MTPVSLKQHGDIMQAVFLQGGAAQGAFQDEAGLLRDPQGREIVDVDAQPRALQAAGCERFFFKYCSTFDSTDQGNIGPVGDALLKHDFVAGSTESRSFGSGKALGEFVFHPASPGAAGCGPMGG